MEIREELPPEAPKETPKVKRVEHTSNALPESVQRGRDIMKKEPTETDDEENKKLSAFFRKLEKEEKEEQEEGGRVEAQINQGRLIQQEEEEESEFGDSDQDDEDRYDMEVSSNMFDHFDDDDEYPYDQIVEQEDFSCHSPQPQQDDEFDQDDDRSVPKVVAKKKYKPAALENTVKETSVEEEMVPESKIVHAPIVQEAPVSEKKVSKFKLARQQPKEEAVSKVEPVKVGDPPAASPPSKKVSKFKLARQEQQQKEQVVNEEEPVKPEVVATPAKKVSKFKLARQQQEEAEPVKDEVMEDAVPQVKKMSKFKLARQQPETVTEKVVEEKTPSVHVVSEPANQSQQLQDQQIPSNKHMIPDVTCSKPKRRFKPTIPQRRAGKSQRKVTFDTSTSVREHDNRMAPSVVSETQSYSEPVKNEGTDNTIRSPADIFRVVKQTQMQQLEQDDYPSFGEEDEPMEVDLNELVKAARIVPQNLWRSNDGSEMRMPIPHYDEEEEEEKGIIIANKNKLDTNIMRGAVMERETKPVDMEKVEDDMDLNEINNSYQQKRQSMLAVTGGFSFDPKPEFEVKNEMI
jgi:hypothetical protein